MPPVDLYIGEPWAIALAVAIGLATGVLSGLMGVGGGIVFVPAAVLLLGLSQHDAQGVSLAVIVPTSLVGAYTHWRYGNIDWRAVLLLGPAAVAGGVVAAAAAQQLPPESLRLIFALLLAYVAQRYIGVDVWLLGRLRGLRRA